MKIRRMIGQMIYHAIGKRLPRSAGRFGFAGKRIRAFCGGLMLDHCGKQVNIEKGAQFDCRISLGDYSGIGVNASIPAFVTIGNHVMMGPDCMMFTSNHGMQDPDIPMWRQPLSDAKPIVIEDDVWIGARVILLPGVRVGRGSVIGAGSVVTHDVAPYSIVGGNPARLIRYRNRPHGEENP